MDGPGGVLCENRAANTIWRGGNSVHPNTGGVMESIQDGGSGGNDGLLTDALSAERAYRRGVFDENGFDGRDVAGGRDEVVMQVFALPGKKFFHERHANALRHTAFDLAFDERGIDGAADIVRRGNF